MNRLFLLLGTLLFLLSCGDSVQEKENDENPVLPPQYYYYPKANVYFDSANKEYLFQSNDSLNWQSAKQIPAVVLAMMDKYILIQQPSDPVWLDNENHRLVYSAVLYATADDTVAKKKVQKPAQKPFTLPTKDSVTAEKKERKGLGKLLDKIFGRNKKKKDEKQEAPAP